MKSKTNKTNDSTTNKFSGSNGKVQKSKENSRNSRNRVRNSGDTDITCKSNDPGWYNTDPTLMNAAANISFYGPLGLNHSSEMHTVKEMIRHTSFEVPGILALHTVPAVDMSVNEASALNTAANALYSFTRHCNTGSKLYDDPDLLLMILGVSQVYSAMAWLTRGYRAAFSYQPLNRYLPTQLVEACGFDYIDLENNLADYGYRIRRLALELSNLVIPNNLPILNRMIQVYSYVYADGTSQKDQLYLLRPDAFWKFDKDEDGAGMLKLYRVLPSDASTKNIKMSDAIDYVYDMMLRLTRSFDIGTMCGDLLKAYGANGVLRFDGNIELNVPLPITVGDEEVLYQIRNARIFKDVETSIKQDAAKGKLLALNICSMQECSDGEIHRQVGSKFIVSKTAQPSPVELAAITRLTAMGVSTSNVQEGLMLSCGTEIVTDLSMYFSSGETDNVIYTSEKVADLDASQLGLSLLSKYICFAYAPEIWIHYDNEDDSAARVFNLDNYAVVDYDVMARIHDAATMNLITIPAVNTLNSITKK